MEEKDGRATLVVTYNSVRNFPAGTYRGKNGPVIVLSDESIRNWRYPEAEDRFSQIIFDLHKINKSLDINEIFVYLGARNLLGTLCAARNIAKGDGLVIVACDCNPDIKEQTAEQIGARITWSDCGGKYALEDIVRSKLRTG